MKAFTEEIGRSGSWRGQALEGFVVRTHVSEPPTRPGQEARASPYAPGSSFFFKVKFDEPYMMYRDWREVTKTLLSKGPTLSNVPKGKMRRAETKTYARWIINEIKRDRAQFEGFTKGKGIIATRERFLKWMETSDGKLELETTTEQEIVKVEGDQKKFGKTIIVPVAIPGVGAWIYPGPYTHPVLTSGHFQVKQPSQSHSHIYLASDMCKATTYARRSLVRSSSRMSQTCSKHTMSSLPTSMSLLLRLV